MLSALLIHGVPIECINHAAEQYYVPAKVIISVLETEGGKVGLKSPNKNGTFDYGPMQINTVWIHKIAPFGYSEQRVQYDACANVMAGTWILSQQIADENNEKLSTNDTFNSPNVLSYWKGIGDYHSHTLTKNILYQQKVYRHYALLEKELHYAA